MEEFSKSLPHLNPWQMLLSTFLQPTDILSNNVYNPWGPCWPMIMEAVDSASGEHQVDGEFREEKCPIFWSQVSKWNIIRSQKHWSSEILGASPITYIL